ncbi:MAG: flagellar biosynthesis protein FlhB [Formivibrio sp.]|nr:flagellar biosynthesis protein FlhB [Formivibrio sp.]
MAEDSDLERTEPPSPRRLEDARRKGQVPRSRELSTFAVLMTGLLSAFWGGPELYAAIKQITVTEFTFTHASLADPNQMPLHFISSLRIALLALMPIFLATVLAAVLTPVMIGGWLFSFETLSPNFGRMNPMSGIGRIFSVRSIVEMFKTILKSGLVGGIAALTLWNERDQFLALIMMPMDSGLFYLWQMMRFTLLMSVSGIAAIVLIDVPYQLWDYHKGLRMTKEEVRQEMKEMEGSPEIKGRIRQLQREAARKRMMSAIPKADVVVTNPTHYAVAIQYEAGMRAPKVVAKGSFLLAERIIDIAKEHRVAIIRTPPFARALYHHADLGEEIPSALYTAAAEVLAYIYQLKQFQRHGGTAPELNDNLPVPAELDPEATG